MADKQEVKMEEGLITEEMLAEMRSKIGLKLRTENSQCNEEATRLAITKFADGIGDPNSLWRDEEYAAKTRYGRLAAPPSWIWSVFGGAQFGWRGLGGFHSGSDIEFNLPVLHGDRIKPECIFTGFEGPMPSKFAEKMVTDYYQSNYYNQENKKIARIVWWVIRTERRKAREKGKYSAIQLPHPWKEEELKKAEEDVLAEEIRGANPRYWENVEIGDELKPVVKGPLGLTDMIAFNIGGGAPIPRMAAHGVQLRQYRRHPAWAFRDVNTYALEPIFAVHYNKAAANAMGLPFPYDVGTQRHCWQIHLLTNWMGDDAWLKRSYAEYRRFVYLSDAVWIKGKVTKKYMDEEGEHCVEVETSAINQRGEEVMPGRAVIALPSKGKDPRLQPLARRLPSLT